jgi:hypothetical protein
MRGDVGELARAVAGGGDDAALAHDDRPDGDFSACARRLGLAQRDIHETRCRHAASSSRFAARPLVRHRA